MTLIDGRLTGIHHRLYHGSLCIGRATGERERRVAAWHHESSRSSAQQRSAGETSGDASTEPQVRRAEMGYSTTMLQRYTITPLQRYSATALQRYSATALQSYNATMLHRIPSIPTTLHDATMLRPYTVTMIWCYNSTPLHHGGENCTTVHYMYPAPHSITIVSSLINIVSVRLNVVTFCSSLSMNVNNSSKY